ncbi:hypothetical protein ABPG73_001733 [Tetrahymena malaccensis]
MIFQSNLYIVNQEYNTIIYQEVSNQAFKYSSISEDGIITETHQIYGSIDLDNHINHFAIDTKNSNLHVITQNFFSDIYKEVSICRDNILKVIQNIFYYACLDRENRFILKSLTFQGLLNSPIILSGENISFGLNFIQFNNYFFFNGNKYPKPHYAQLEKEIYLIYDKWNLFVYRDSLFKMISSKDQLLDNTIQVKLNKHFNNRIFISNVIELSQIVLIFIFDYESRTFKFYNAEDLSIVQSNAIYIPNAKYLRILQIDDIIYIDQLSYKLNYCNEESKVIIKLISEKFLQSFQITQNNLKNLVEEFDLRLCEIQDEMLINFNICSIIKYHIYLIQNKFFVFICPISYVFDITSNKCVCQLNSTQLEYKCICNTSYININGQCEKCPLNCHQCLTQTYCQICNEGYYVDKSGVCVLNFTKNTQLLEKNIIQLHNSQLYDNRMNNSKTKVRLTTSCSQFCTSCTSPTNCTACQSGFYLSNQQSCISNCFAASNCPCLNKTYSCDQSGNGAAQCQSGQYVDHNGQSYPCPSNCNMLKPGITCTICGSGFLNILDGTCISSSSCTAPFIANNSNQSCSCRPNSTLQGSACPCNTGYLDVGGVCQSCPSNCNQCSSQTVCTSCQSGYYLFIDGTCKSPCPTTFTPNSSNQSCVCRQNSSLQTNICPCNTGFVDLGGVCQACPSNCNQCSSQTACTTCQPTYYLFVDGTCKSPCPATFQANNQNQSCVCRPNSTLSTNTCPCNTGYLDVAGICQQCPTNCNQCSSQTTCTTCSSGYYLFIDGTCVSQCPATFSINSSTQSCVCRANSSLQTNTCPCNSGYLDVGGSCLACNANCIKCSSQTTCTQCASGYFLFVDATCVSTCPATFITDNQNQSCTCRANSTLQTNTCPCNTGYLDVGGNCLPCGANCNQCSTQTTCTVCSPGYFLFVDGTCVSQCPSTFNTDSSNTKCICRNNSSLKNNSCPCNVQYLDVQGICQKCPSNCDQCSSQTVCSVCSQGYYLQIDNTCVSQCPTTFVKDSTNTKCVCRPNSVLQNSICPCISSGFIDINDVCESCPSQCDKCSSQTVCISCISQYYLTINATCSSPCPSSFIQDSSNTKCVCPISSNLINGVCVPCDSNCLTCTVANNKQCTSCFDGFILKDSTCLQQFQQYNSTVFTDQKIQEIQQQTQTASQISSVSSIGLSAAQNVMSSSSFGVSQSGLTSQKLSYLILVKTNFPAHIFKQINALKGQLPSQSFKLTTSCSQYCTSCSSPTECTACQSGFQVTTQKTCVSNCYFASNCPCKDKPYACDQSGNGASICQSGYFIHQNGFQYPCPSNCNLLKAGITCTICSPNYYLNIVDGGCISSSSCAAPFIINVSNQSCQCPADRTLQDSSCPCNTGSLDVAGVCQPCPANCNQCSSQTVCTSCQQGYYLFIDGTCKSPCPAMFRPDYSNTSCVCRPNSSLQTNNCPCNTGFVDLGGVCQACPSNCNSCSSQTACTTCQPTYYLFVDGTCKSPCPATFQANNSNQSCVCRPNSTLSTNTCPCNFQYLDVQGICQKCPSNCDSCLSQTVCSVCSLGYYLKIDNTCVSQCPTTFVKDSTNTKCVCRPNSVLQNAICPCISSGFIDINDVCESCPSKCDKCSSQTVCISCISQYYLTINATCNSSCPSSFIQDSSNTKCVCPISSNLINGVCVPCDSNCLTCTVANNKQCTSCFDGFILKDSTCLQQFQQYNSTVFTDQKIQEIQQQTQTASQISSVSSIGLSAAQNVMSSSSFGVSQSGLTSQKLSYLILVKTNFPAHIFKQINALKGQLPSQSFKQLNLFLLFINQSDIQYYDAKFESVGLAYYTLATCGQALVIFLICLFSFGLFYILSVRIQNQNYFQLTITIFMIGINVQVKQYMNHFNAGSLLIEIPLLIMMFGIYIGTFYTFYIYLNKISLQQQQFSNIVKQKLQNETKEEFKPTRNFILIVLLFESFIIPTYFIQLSQYWLVVCIISIAVSLSQLIVVAYYLPFHSKLTNAYFIVQYFSWVFLYVQYLLLNIYCTQPDLDKYTSQIDTVSQIFIITVQIILVEQPVYMILALLVQLITTIQQKFQQKKKQKQTEELNQDMSLLLAKGGGISSIQKKIMNNYDIEMKHSETFQQILKINYMSRRKKANNPNETNSIIYQEVNSDLFKYSQLNSQGLVSFTFQIDGYISLDQYQNHFVINSNIFIYACIDLQNQIILKSQSFEQLFESSSIFYGSNISSVLNFIQLSDHLYLNQLEYSQLLSAVLPYFLSEVYLIDLQWNLYFVDNTLFKVILNQELVLDMIKIKLDPFSRFFISNLVEFPQIDLIFTFDYEKRLFTFYNVKDLSEVQTDQRLCQIKNKMLITFNICLIMKHPLYLISSRLFGLVCPLTYVLDISQNKCVCQANSTLQQQNQKCICNTSFVDIDGFCEKCPLNCYKCLNQNTCIICKYGYQKNKDGFCAFNFSDINSKYFSNKKFVISQISQQDNFQSYKPNKITRLIANCPFKCKKCSSPKECTECSKGYYLAGNKKCINTCFAASNCSCLGQLYACNQSANGPAECDQGQYIDHNGDSAKCPPNCNSLPEGVTCNICVGGFLFKDGKCIDKCPATFIENKQNLQCDCRQNSSYSISDQMCTCNPGYFEKEGECQQCISKCNKCVSQNTCLQCSPGYFIFIDKTCVSKCPSTFIANNSNQSCECRPNSQLSVNKCICNSGYFEIGDNCQQCTSNCSQCVSSSTCSKCISGYYLLRDGFQLLSDESCVQKCPDTFIKDNLNQSCICRPNSYLSANKCSCNPGYFEVESNCSQCTSNCIQCSTQTTCSQCQLGFYLFVDGTCIFNCPSTFILSDSNCICRPHSTLQKNVINTCICNDGYIDIGGTCEACTPNCDQCVTQKTCNKCSSGYYLFIDGTCIKTCPQSFYPDLKNKCTCRPNSTLIKDICVCNIGFVDIGGDCKSCPQNCNQCESQYLCLVCQENYYLHVNGTCVSQCPATFNIDQAQKKCICRQNNQTCNDTCPDTFLIDSTKQACVCRSYSTLKKGECQCNTGYLDVSGICQPCSQNCDQCLSQSVCAICSPNYYLLNNSNCVSECPKTFQADFSTKQCICRPNSFLLKQYYLFNFEKTNFFLLSNNCICNNGFVDLNGECKPCSSNCDVCSSQTVCLTCSSGYLLNIDSACVSECSQSFVPDSAHSKCVCRSNSSLQNKYCHCDAKYLDIDGVCQQCPQNCDQCSSQTVCSTCSSRYFLQIDNTCAIQCPRTFVQDQSNNRCVCRPNSILQNDICTCISSGFIDIDDVCQPCPAYCDQCSSQTVCSTCTSGYYLTVNQTCSQQCPSSFIQDPNNNTKCICPISSNLKNGICIPCDPNCLTCLADNNEQCLSCYDGFTLKDYTCIQQQKTYNSTIFTDNKIEEIKEQTQTTSQISSVSSIGLSAAQNAFSSSSFGVSQSGLTSQKLSYLILVSINFPDHIFQQINALKGQLPSQSFKQLNLFLKFTDLTNIQYHNKNFESVGLAYYILITCGQALIQNPNLKTKLSKIYEIVFCSFIVQYFQLTMTIFIIGINSQIKQYVSKQSYGNLLFEVPLIIIMLGISVGTYYAFYIILNRASLQKEQFYQIVKQKLQNETKEEFFMTRNYILIILLFESFIIPTYFIQLSQDWLAVCIISILVSLSQLLIVIYYMPFQSKLTNTYFIVQHFSWLFLYILYLILNIYCTRPDLNAFAKQIDIFSYIFIITVQIILVQQPFYMTLALLVQLFTAIRQILIKKKENKMLEDFNKSLSLTIANGGGISYLEKNITNFYDIELKHSKLFDEMTKKKYWSRKIRNNLPNFTNQNYFLQKC